MTCGRNVLPRQLRNCQYLLALPSGPCLPPCPCTLILLCPACLQVVASFGSSPAGVASMAANLSATPPIIYVSLFGPATADST